MPTLQIHTTQNVAIDYEVANIGERLFAAIVDWLIVFAYWLAMGWIFSNTRFTSDVLFVIVFGGPILLYHLICELAFNGQSFGKMARNIRVVKLDGTPPELANYLLRWLFRTIDVGISFGAIGVVSILASSKSQRLGDLVAGTTVVKERPGISLEETILEELEDDYTVVFPAVAYMENRDVATVREVLTVLTDSAELSTKRKLEEKTLVTLQRVLGKRPEMSTIEALKTILKDYNYIKGREL